MASTLAALPAPGLAIFPDLIAQKQETIIMKADYFQKTFAVYLQDGTPILTITGESLSLSRRKTFTNAQGTQLCQLRHHKRGKYYAETSSGQNIWNLSAKSRFMGTRSVVSFANVVDGARQVEMDMKARFISGTLRWGNLDVAVVERKSWKMKAEYHITIAAGCDMFLPVALVLALHDKAKAASSGGAAGAGGGAAC
ncbi:DUF567-domain-containing protein [Venturia nashicola]|uniref:DUF567-domain-containing protein n=1 Tax=Venturia nashicola TaxID=86259 RepID=A0A4Z1NS43_9PEZI|nr:DUF567-domain-containing protein [Venturia nashicola]TLD28070.1 DUF567-domain-containing protein [Venturia nashicola]